MPIKNKRFSFQVFGHDVIYYNLQKIKMIISVNLEPIKLQAYKT